MKRKRLLLTILLGVFILSLGYCYWAMPRQQRVAQSGTAGESAVARPAVVQGTAVRGRQLQRKVDDTRLHLEWLEDDAGRFPGYKRNIFGTVQPPPPPPVPVKTKPAPVTAPPPPPPPPVVQPVQQELAHFNFLGYLEKDGEKTVFLGRDEHLYLVKRGGRFGPDGKFLVTELSPERLVIRVAGDSREIVVPLVENQPLIPQFRAGGGTASSPRPGVSPRFSPGAVTNGIPLPPGNATIPASPPVPATGEAPSGNSTPEPPAVPNEGGQ